MSVCVVTGHTGEAWDRLAALTLPALAAYCDRHGYELCDVSADLPTLADGRPPSWGKVRALGVVLYDCDVAVWIDADVLVMPGAPPIHAELLADEWQALVVHHVPEGMVPNCGVWVLRPPMVDVLDSMWRRIEYVTHPWWEQAALIAEMDYDTAHSIFQRNDNRLWLHTAVLDTRWNAHPADWRDDAYMRHASGIADMAAREAMVRAWLGEARPAC